MTVIATYRNGMPGDETRVVRERHVLADQPDGSIGVSTRIEIERVRPVEYGAEAWVSTGGGIIHDEL
jgi:hypothetical protein